MKKRIYGVTYNYTAASGTAYQIKASAYSYSYVDFTKKFIYAGGISGVGGKSVRQADVSGGTQGNSVLYRTGYTVRL